MKEEQVMCLSLTVCTIEVLCELFADIAAAPASVAPEENMEVFIPSAL